MILPGIEQVAYDKGITAGKEIGVEIGIEKGRIQQREEDRKKLYQYLLNQEFKEEAAKNFLKGYSETKLD